MDHLLLALLVQWERSKSNLSGLPHCRKSPALPQFTLYIGLDTCTYIFPQNVLLSRNILFPKQHFNSFAAFITAPNDTCIPSGQSAEFYCQTVSLAHDTFALQEWNILTPGGGSIRFTSTSNISSTIPIPGYEWILKTINMQASLLIGLRVVNVNSSLNGATFQCIAVFRQERNDSAPAARLEVAGM